MRVDHLGLGVEVEHPADLGNEVHEAREVVDVRAQHERLAVRAVAHLDHARCAVEADRAPVDARVEVDVLDPGNSARCEELEQRIPRERRPVREPQLAIRRPRRGATDRAAGPAARAV